RRGPATVPQAQDRRAPRTAGRAVPKLTIDTSPADLQHRTTANGGVIYSLAHGGAFNGGERPPLTAAAISCLFSAGDYKSELAKKWIKFCQRAIPIDKSGSDSFGHWEYTHYYYAQALYVLGYDGYAKMFPDSRPGERLSWNKYREVIFDY